MKRITLPILSLVAALALPALALPAIDAQASGAPTLTAAVDGDEPLKIGSTVAESVTMRDLDGKSITFKELRGKTLLIHFWSDRCPAEKHGDPVFKALEGYYKDKKDVVMIGIAANQGEIGPAPEKDADFSKLYTNLREKMTKVGLTHRMFADHGNKLTDLFAAKSTPHCFVVDAKGVLRYSGALDDDMQGKKGDAATVYVRDAVDALLAGKEVEVTQTRPYG